MSEAGMGTERPAPPAASRENAVEMDAEHITTSRRDPAELAERLRVWLADRLGPGNPPVISEVSSPESNGMSSETLLFTGVWDEDDGPTAHRLVARIEPPATDYPVFTTYDLGMQFRVMRLVREHTRVPVPETFWYEPDPSVLGGSFFVMARIEGLVPPDVLPYTFGDNWVFDGSDADRRKVQESAIRAMAGIHSITPDRYDLSFLEHPAPGETSLRRSLNHWRTYYEWVVKDAPSPLLADCFDWLDDHFPTDAGPDALSWGDGRIGNMMFRDNEVVAVLDWEMAGVAPPEVDLGWMSYLHLFFQDLAVDLGAPGLPRMFRPAEVVESYAKVSGHQPADLTWYIAFAAIRHGAIMRRVTERSIFFGESEPPDDIDDLIIHRATLRGILDGSYWAGVAL
jgi:aminoglycoside phosphotransferase (APT) family kinase protein